MTTQNLHNKLIMQRAQEMGMDCNILSPGCEDFLELSYRGKSIIINKTRSHKLPFMAGLISKNKDVSNILLDRAGLPVPKYIVLTEIDDRALAFLNENKMVVVKPWDTNRSLGITIGIETEIELKQAIDVAKLYSDKVMIQKYVEGFDYRVLVIDGEVVAVQEYRPPMVIGNGISTIKQLIKQLNDDPLRRQKKEDLRPLKKIDTESDLLMFNLEKQGKKISDILAENEKVWLFLNGNVLIGGKSFDRTDEICIFNKELAINAAKTLGIDVAGIDIRCKNIGIPIYEQDAGILEVNVLPDLIDHYIPYHGQSRDVFGAYLKYLFKDC
ncbi:TPA: hypothetical protein QCX34_004416 [Bacillus anthracis]|nr:hypothetical protein [Bacillus anthracis]